MATARDIMNAGVTWVGEHETLSAAAQHTRENDIDITRHQPEHAVVQFVGAICSPAPSPADCAGGRSRSAVRNSTDAKTAIGHQFRRLRHA